MLIEDQRLLHEDLERLENAIADRLQDGDPKHIRDRLARDHQISTFLQQFETQSDRLLKIYEDPESTKETENRELGLGDPNESFYAKLKELNDFHRRYPREPVENLEKAYNKRSPEDQAAAIHEIDLMFTGEEGFGRFFDLTTQHEQYFNLPGTQHAKRVTYLQYLDIFDEFTPPKCLLTKQQKLTDPYLIYIKGLRSYLEGFMRKTKPLENLDKLFANWDKEFEEAWEEDQVPGWGKQAAQSAVEAPEQGAGGVWCSACKKDFAKETVYEAHLKGKKHLKNVEAQTKSNGAAKSVVPGLGRFKERTIAEQEFRVKKLASAMQTERSDTKVNVERKQGMTERERQQELENLYAESEELTTRDNEKDEPDSDGEDKIYNPLKLPLAWDGKPIPFWLYKLHGLGVEFPCEICGNFTYMGRRAFDKHFNEPKHVFNLKRMGITNSQLFREITSIEEAQKLWKKIQTDKRKEKQAVDNIVEMEDKDGNVMPEKVYQDLLAAGLV